MFPLQYDNVDFKEIPCMNQWQNRVYEGKLDKGKTYLIGNNQYEKFYLTYFTEGEIEFWVRHVNPNGTAHTKSIMKLSKFEIGTILRALMAQEKIVMSY